MELKNVLAEVPGLNKRLVYYLESQGYIQPTRLPKQRIDRRDYSIVDRSKLKRFWTYYQRGYTVQRAIEAAERVGQSTVLILLPIPAGERLRALDLLRRQDRVLEAALVYGDGHAVLLRMQAVDHRDAYDVLDRVFETAGIASLPRVWRILPSDTSVLWPVANRSGMLAYVMIKAPPKQIGLLIDDLRRLAGIVEASALYGETDVIARIEVAGQDELDDLIMNKIHGLVAVESTRTFIAVGGAHFQR